MVKEDNHEVNIIRDKRGRPYLKKGTPSKLIYATDCFDTETRVRLIAWINILDQYFVHNAAGSILPTESLNQEHLSTVFTSFYFERRSIEKGRFADQDPVLFLANAAPRRAGNRTGAASKFVFAELEGNVYYFGTFGPELSRVKEQIKCLWELAIEHKHAKTSFRSRFLPEMVARWLEHDSAMFVEEVPLSEIPEPQKNIVASVDNFGNIKLGFSERDEEYRSIRHAGEAFVTLNGITHKAKVGAPLGDAQKGEMILTVGTSRTGFGDEDYGIVIYCQNESAIDKFRKPGGEPPQIGQKIEISI